MLKKEEDRLKRELTLKRLRKAIADMVPSLLPACVPGLCSPGHAPVLECAACAALCPAQLSSGIRRQQGTVFAIDNMNSIGYPKF